MSGKDHRIASHWPLSLMSCLAASINLFIPIILVRILSPEEVGQFRIFFLYLLLAPAFTLTGGLKSGIAYWSGQSNRGPDAIALSAYTLLAGSVIVGFLTYLFADTISSALAWPHAHAIVFAWALAAFMLANFYEEASIAYGRLWHGALFGFVFESLRAVVILSVAITYRDLGIVLQASALVIIAKAFCGFFLAFREGWIRTAPDTSLIRPVFAYALPVSLSLPCAVLASHADKLIISLSVSSQDFALYSIGCLAVPPLYILEQSITRVLIPSLARSAETRESERICALYRDACGKLSVFVIPSVVLLILFSDPLITTLFTEQYASASGYLKLFALSYLFLCIPYDALPRAMGDSRWIFRNSFQMAAVGVFLVWLLSSQLGAWGALLAFLITSTIQRFATLSYLSRVTGEQAYKFLPIRRLATEGCLALALALAVAACKVFFASEQSWMLICGPLYVSLFFVLWAALLGPARVVHQEPRVLMVCQTLEIGGLERLVVGFCKRLKNESNWVPSVFAYDQATDNLQTTLIPELQNFGVEVTAFKKPPGFSPRAVLRLWLHSSKEGIDVLHCHDLGGLIYAVFVKLLTFGRMKIVQTQHSFIHLGRNRRYTLYERFFTAFADRVTVVSSDTLKTYIDLGFNSARIELVENGIEFSEVAPAANSEKIALRKALCESVGLRDISAKQLESRWVVYIARLFPGKGQEHAVNMWRSLPESTRACSTLLFIGPDACPEFANRVKGEATTFEREGSVLFTGGVKVPQQWLRAADLFLSCSEFEGMPLAPLEAAGSGLPLMLSDIPGHQFLASCSIQFSLDRLGDSAQHLNEFLSLPEDEVQIVRERQGDVARSLRERFSPGVMLRKYVKIYEEVSAPLPPASHEVLAPAQNLNVS